MLLVLLVLRVLLVLLVLLAVAVAVEVAVEVVPRQPRMVTMELNQRNGRSVRGRKEHGFRSPHLPPCFATTPLRTFLQALHGFLRCSAAPPQRPARGLVHHKHAEPQAPHIPPLPQPAAGGHATAALLCQ